MNTIFGKFNRETREIELNNSRYSYYENDAYFCSLYGDVWIDGKHNDYSVIVDAYHNFGDDIVNQIEGLFYLIIYEKGNNVLKIYQDYFTSCETLYYTLLNDIFYFTNDMRKIVSLSKQMRVFNREASIEFAKYGCVPGMDTLISNVHKIAPFHMLLLQDDRVIQRKLDYKFHVQEEDLSAQKWVTNLNRSIQMNTPETDSVTLPLSGGFDSNYIFHFYNRSKRKTQLFTVGGTDGIDESKMVEKIVKAYHSDRNQLNVFHTSDDTLKYLPDIIWRLGGLVYQRGIFLQYELARGLSKVGATSLVCGECADQVMHENFRQSGMDNDNPQYVGPANPYSFAADIIVKKSGVMLNSFGIKGYYPYMNQRFMETAMGVARRNGTTKAYHRKICGQVLPKEVVKCLYKNGGATYMHSLFATDEEKKQFVHVVENSAIFKEIQAVKGVKKTRVEKIKFVLDKCKEYSKGFFRRVIGTLGVQGIETLMPKYIKMESRLRRDMGYFYMMVFEELFCSERTDMYLEDGVESFDIHAYIKRLNEEL